MMLAANKESRSKDDAIRIARTYFYKSASIPGTAILNFSKNGRKTNFSSPAKIFTIYVRYLFGVSPPYYVSDKKCDLYIPIRFQLFYPIKQ